MALDSYANLKQAIADYDDRGTTLDSQIPDFITLAESTFNYGEDDIDPLRTRDMETSDTITLTSGEGTLPTDTLEIIRVTATSNPRRKLEYAPADWLDEAYPTADSGDPSFYTVLGSTIIVRPVTSDSIELRSYQKIPALSDANTTNWLLAAAPNAYLFGALMHLHLYADGELQKAAAMKQLMRSSLAGIQRSALFSRSGTAARRANGQTP